MSNENIDLLKTVKSSDDSIVKFFVEGHYKPFYYLAPENYHTKQPSDDIANCIEYTLHALLDNNVSDTDIYDLLCAEKREDFNEESMLYIDLNYVIDGIILAVKNLGKEI